MAWEDVTGANPNLTRFLDFIAKAEGADWNTIVGGGKFSDFSQHPNVVGLRTSDGPSTAAGRYQITGSTYRDVAPKLGINDFSRDSQNQIAIELIRRGGALEDVLSGQYEPAIQKLGSTWASLPSSPYNQPKRDWNFVKANLQANSNDGWEDVAPANDGWETVGPPQSNSPSPAPTAAAPAPVPAPAKAPSKKEDNRSVLRRVDDFVRGVADTVTFGYADELAAKLDSLVGGGQSGKKTYEEAVKAQRQRDAEGGAERTVGQLTGAFMPGAAAVGAVRAVPTAGRLARVGAGAATGAIQGGLYGSGSAEEGQRLEGAATGALTGAALGGVLGGVLPATKGQKANSYIKEAGSEADAALNAEIAQRAAAEFNNAARTVKGELPALGAKELNQKVTNGILREGIAAVEQLPKDSAVRKPFLDALRRGAGNTQGELEKLAQMPGGQKVVDIINAAQRADKMTAANPADNNMLVKGIRVAADYALPGVLSKPINYVLNNRKTREEVGKGVVKAGEEIAPTVLGKVGPSDASKSLQALQEMASKAQSARQAQIEAAKKVAEAKAAEAASTRIQVLQDTRRPLSGAFQELLPGGASNLNLSSKEAIDALRLVSRQQKEGPVGTAAMEILRSGNVANKDAFYGLQNQLRKLQEQGILGGQPGALSSATASIRNPVSYAEAVRTAGEAANLARANAPTKELAQFATSVAGIKAPAEKAQAVAERLAKATDPAEAAFLKQFVEPLTKFGSKAKK